jgi:hypothetical protein
MKFQPGNTIGKAGKPRGTRNKLAATVFEDVLAFWDEPAKEGSDLTKGQAALLSMWRSRPHEFVKVVTGMMPREFLFDHVVTELGDEKLDTLILRMREQLGVIKSDPLLIEGNARCAETVVPHD